MTIGFRIPCPLRKKWRVLCPRCSDKWRGVRAPSKDIAAQIKRWHWDVSDAMWRDKLETEGYARSRK